jgi:hypothetical protein
MTAAVDQSRTYIIEVEGQLSPHWLSLFGHLSPQVEATPGGATRITLSGVFADQAALHGVLQSLYNLGCVLVSVKRREA